MPQTAPPAPGETGPDPSLDWLPRIDDATNWRRLAAPSTEHAVARTDVVKFLIDLVVPEVYFCQSGKWPLHWEFARRFLHSPEHPVPDRDVFGVAEYRRADRRFVVGSVVHYRDADLWTMELRPGDNLAGPAVLDAFRRLRERVFFGDRLRYLARSDLHRERLGAVAEELPVIEPTAVLSGARYQPLTTGVAYGWLRIVRGPLDPTSVRPNEILVTSDVPDDVPLAAALVTSGLQAPLAHVAVLSQGRGTPNMALRGAADDPHIAALDRRLVRLEVGPTDWVLEPATEPEARAAWDARRPARAFTPERDERDAALRSLCAVGSLDVDVVGAKAANLGEVCRLRPPIRTPGGFVVPFAAYVEHMRRSGAEARAVAVLADPGFAADLARRSGALDELRRTIEQAPVDPRLLEQIVARIHTLPRRRLIFRSSTNAEDLVGFSGAGLYRSVVVDANPTGEQVATALRQVWASVWSFGAFEERDWYRVDHRGVAMAVLVQPFVDDVAAIGVAITSNPFSDVRQGSLINVQVQGGSVTAAGDELPEQILAVPRAEPEVLCRSTRTNGAPILSRDDVWLLQSLLVRLHEHFVPRWGEGGDAVDVEFLFTRSRVPVILQARPYRMGSRR